MTEPITFTDLGMISDTRPSRTNSEHADGHATESPISRDNDNIVTLAPQQAAIEQVDHFVERDGVVFAGTHLIVDLWGASRLDDMAHVDATLRRAVEVSGATLLHIHLHRFTPYGGVSGVAILAESHISIHTWPERDYAAIDIFMCGTAAPHKAVPVLKQAFEAGSMQIGDHKRGIVG